MNSPLNIGDLSAAQRALMAQLLEEEGIALSASQTIPQREVSSTDDDGLQLSFAQQRIWFLHQLDSGSHYNEHFALRLQGRVKSAFLAQSLNAIVSRHEALRTAYTHVDGQPLQVILSERQIPLEITTLGAGAAGRNERPSHEQKDVYTNGNGFHPTGSAHNQPSSESHLFQNALTDESLSPDLGMLDRMITQEIQRPFDLVAGDVLRATLFSISETAHVLLFVMHHIAADGWSMEVLSKEIMTLYTGMVGDPDFDMASALPDLPVQYADYALWHRGWLEDEGMEAQVRYWQEQLGGTLPLLQLPTDHPRPAKQGYAGKKASITLPKALTDRVKTLARDEEATLFMVLLAAFNTLLYRYTGQQDLIVGTPIAGRNWPEIENLIGFFTNTLALRTAVTDDLTFQTLLQRVQVTATDAFKYQDIPFEKLVEILQPQRDPSYSPIIQVMFVLQNSPVNDLQTPPDLAVSLYDTDSGTSKFDMAMEVMDQAEGLKVWFEYNTDLFEHETVQRMLNHYQTLLEGIVADPAQSIGELPLLTTGELDQMLVQWNDTATAYTPACIHQMVEAQVRKSPDAIAVCFDKEQLTYQELNQRANRLAHHLLDLGVRPETLVGISVERSIDMVVGLLGILKVGGAYVALDPRYPRDRLAFMLDDMEAKFLLTQEHLVSVLPTHNAAVICLDRDWGVISTKNPDNIEVNLSPENLAYVIYTSGSTGKPKGVLVEHKGVGNLALAQIEAFRVGPESRVLQFASFSFDAAISEVVMALLAGATLVMAHQEALMPGPNLIRLLKKQKITTVTLPPSALAILSPKGLRDLKTVISAGEACSAEIVTRWAEEHHFLNAYGPAESTVCATIGQCTVTEYEHSHRVPSIGRPIDNTQIYLLDANRQPVPIGVSGELYIGSIGLARGYLNRPELTRERFIANPFSQADFDMGFGQAKGQLDQPDPPTFRLNGANLSPFLYKTGDLARYLPDGQIEFLGRIDHQIKLRGFRIELGEIESVLAQYPDVQDVSVIDREDQPGEKRLVAYMVAGENKARLNTDTLRAYLQEKVPDYMVPAAFVFLDSLPLTPNNKVDRQALPAPEAMVQEVDSDFAAPRDVLEMQLAKIWEKVLNRKPVGLHDNFFALGGHSLLAVRLFAEVEALFGQTLAIATLFQAPTVAQLAEILRHEDWSPPWSAIIPIQPNGSKPPFFCIHGGDGNVLYYRDLAHYLGQDQPFYGLQAVGLAGEQPHTTVEEMAAHYIREIRLFQPQGPYYLGGYCTGGTVAYEMAQQLLAQGEAVAFLALLDTQNWPSDNRRSRRDHLRHFWERFEFLGRNFLSLPAKEKGTFIREKVKVIQERLQVWLMGRTTNGAYKYQLIDVNDRAIRSYNAQPYGAQITYFKPRRVYSRYAAPALDWERLAPGRVRVVDLPVYPGSMIEEPFVRMLAERMQEALQEEALEKEAQKPMARLLQEA